MFSGVDRYFRSDLADEIRKEGNYEVASIISLSGIASSQGGTYQVNKVDFLNLVRAQITLYNYETQYWKVFSSGWQAWARLEAAVGAPIAKGVNNE